MPRSRPSPAHRAVLATCVAFAACAAGTNGGSAVRPAEDLGTLQGRGQAPVAGDRRIGVAVGTTGSPDTFMLTGAAEFYQTDQLAIGPMLQLGFDDTTAIIAPSFLGKYVFPIERSGDDPLFLPFLRGGVGLCYLQKDRPGDDDGLGLLLQVGVGLEARFDERYSLSTAVQANLLPGKVVDERTYFSWEIVQLSLRF